MYRMLINSLLISTIYAKSINTQVDLQTAESSYSQQFHDWGGINPGGYSFDINGAIDPTRPDPINGFGGYGGYGGNGGLDAYYGYDNPYYREANHLGFGYYKKIGYGNIYRNGVTPNLVAGYRGYSRR